MFRENSIKTCILSRVKQITSPGWMHETSAWTWALGRPRGIRWRGRWEGGSGWGIHVNPWLIHVSVWKNHYNIVISLQLTKNKWKKFSNIHWITEKIREFQKNLYFCFIDYTKAFDCGDHNKLWKILKEMGIPDHLICLLRNLCRYAGQEKTEPNMEQQTGSNWGKE